MNFFLHRHISFYLDGQSQREGVRASSSYWTEYKGRPLASLGRGRPEVEGAQNAGPAQQQQLRRLHAELRARWSLNQLLVFTAVL